MFSPREARDIDISTLVKLRMAVGASNSTNSTRKFPKKPLICMGSRVLRDMEYVVIETENYPGQYPKRDKFPCMWDFYFPQNAAVFISCETFDLKRGDNLVIGGINQNHKRFRLSGAIFDEFWMKLPVVGDRLSLQFNPKDNPRKAGGFRCTVTCTT